MAKVSANLSVTLGNSIPKNSWVATTGVTQVNVSTSQAIFVVRLNDDGFWGYLYSPRGDSAPTSISVPANSAYCLFIKPDSYTGFGLAIALESKVFSEPVLLINGAETMAELDGNSYLNYFKFDLRPYFDQ